MTTTDEQPPTWYMASRPTFAPGNHVRVRVNLECLYCCDPEFPKCYAKAVADDGRTGTVVDVGHENCTCRWPDLNDESDPQHAAHTVWVKWDERRPYDDPDTMDDGYVFPFDSHFAPEELELVMSDPAHEADLARKYGEESAPDDSDGGTGADRRSP